MINSSIKTNTGPMSGVAGAIAHEVVKYLKSKGCRFVIIDNGGDIAIYNTIYKNNLILKIYTGTTHFNNIALSIKPKKKLLEFVHLLE